MVAGYFHWGRCNRVAPALFPAAVILEIALPWQYPADAAVGSIAMHYEHLVQINDPNDPQIEPLTREQLWLGLVARAERPQYFLVGMDECVIAGRTTLTLRRQMKFGATQLRDLVTYQPPVQVRFDVEPTPGVTGARLIISIEEPQPGELFLRFAYTLQTTADDAVGELDEYRKSAYRDADIDTVRMIRQLAATGILSADGPETVELH